MPPRILSLLFLLACGLIKAQSVSTIFIDTLEITVNNKRIYTHKETSLKFYPKNKDVKFILYQDSTYRLELESFATKLNEFTSLKLSTGSFFSHDTIYPLSYVNLHGSEYEDCSGTRIERYSLQNWLYNAPVPNAKTYIRICFRQVDFAPKDTTNYNYNYREGLWVGKQNDAKEITVNYKNDKKHGPAKVVYENEVSYNVVFVNDIAQNYGMGHFEHPDKKTKAKFSYIIPSIISKSCDSAKSDGFESFYFTREKKEKRVSKHNDLSVHYQEGGGKKDSTEYNVRGDFMEIKNDSMVIQAEFLHIHNLYKTDSLHYYTADIPGGYTKISLKDIGKIYYERDEWKTFTLRTTLVSFVTAAIVSPLISIQKNGFNGGRFRKVSGASLGVMVLSISFGIAFSQKEFLLVPTKKNKKTWSIKQYDY